MIFGDAREKAGEQGGRREGKAARAVPSGPQASARREIWRLEQLTRLHWRPEELASLPNLRHWAVAVVKERHWPISVRKAAIAIACSLAPESATVLGGAEPPRAPSLSQLASPRADAWMVVAALYRPEQPPPPKPPRLGTRHNTTRHAQLMAPLAQ